MGQPDDQPTTVSTTNTDGGAAVSGGTFTAGRSQVLGGVLNDQSTNVGSIGSIASEVTVVGSGNTVSVSLEERAYTVSGISPFRGLLAYTYEERDIYAGRERQVQLALERLTGTPPLPLLFVIGASGSGKSSFAQAGLRPALEGYYGSHNRKLAAAVFHPGEQPRAALYRALPGLHLSNAHAEDLPAQLADPTSLNRFLSGGPREQVNLLIIDQFEELFTQSAVDEREWLLGWLAQLPDFATSHTHVVATMRSDYLPALFDRQSLYEVAKGGVDLRKMSVAELEMAIQRPLAVNYPAKQFEPALLQRLAADTAPDPTYLPLLQATLEELWRGGSLRAGAYDGDISGAISRRADAVLAYHNADEQQPRSVEEQAAILGLLTDLVQVSPDQEFSDTRQQRSYAALVGDSRQRAALVQELSNERLLSVETVDDADSNGEAVQVSIIHESLIKNWGRLREAIKEQQTQLMARERFEQQLAEWQGHSRSNEYLLIGVRLAEAQELATSGDVAMQDAAAKALLAASVAAAEAEQQRQLKLAQDAAAAARTTTRRTRIAAGIVSVLLLLALGAGYFAFVGQQVATEQRQVAVNAQATAEAQANRSESLRLAQAANEQFRQNKPATALRLGYEAVSVDDNDLSRNAIYQVLPTAPEPVTNLPHKGRVNSAVFSPDGTRLLTSSSDRTAKLRDTAGKLLATMQHGDDVSSAVFSPDGTRLLTSSSDQTAKLWDINGKLLATMQHDSWVRSAVFSPDGIWLLTASDDYTAKLWDTNGKLLVTMQHTSAVNSAVFSPDETRLLTASDDYTTKLWDTDGKLLATMRHDGRVSSAVFSPDGTRLLTASWYPLSNTGNAKLWDTEGRLLVTMQHDSRVNGAVFSPDGTRLLTASGKPLSNTGNAKLWDSSGKLLTTMPHTSNVNDAVLSPDGTRLLTASGDILSNTGSAKLWDTDGKLLATMWHDGRVNDAVFSPDGTRLLTASDDHTAKLWDTKGKLLATMQHDGFVYRAAFRPDGTRLLTASWDKTAKLWDKDGKLLATMPHDTYVSSAVFSPDGNFMLSSTAADIMSSAAANTYLWGKEGKLLGKVSGRALSFWPDSSRFLVAEDNVVRTYPIRSEDLLKIAACRIPGDFTPEELRQFSITQPRFDYSKRVCPPQVSWKQAQPTASPLSPEWSPRPGP